MTACAHAGRLQDLDTLTQMAERDPVQVRAGLARRLLQLRKRLFFDRHDGDVVAEAASALQRQEGKPAVAGDETDAGHRLVSLSKHPRCLRPRPEVIGDDIRRAHHATTAVAAGASNDLPLICHRVPGLLVQRSR